MTKATIKQDRFRSRSIRIPPHPGVTSETARPTREYLVRHPGNPIIRPGDLPFRANAVFNSGAAVHEGRIYMVLNCWDGAWEPRFLTAHSEDGIRFQIEPENVFPELKDHFFWHYRGMFDTRVTPLEGMYYITYNTYAPQAGGRVRLMRTRDFRSMEDCGFITGADHRNCVLFPEKIQGRYVRLERPNGQSGLGEIFISYSPDLTHWGQAKLLLRKGTRYWESSKVGPGAPPIRTQQGWLVIYHGCREHMNGLMYNMGCMLLDLEDPSRIIGKMRECLLWPEEPYELAGNCPNVVFPTAAIRHGEEDELKVYYGAADKCMAMARGSISQLVQRCLDDGPINYDGKG